MTQEEKANALYKAAEPMSGCNVILETLFPELKESENERIRKWLIAQLKIKIGDNATLNNIIYKAIAWLEKQGEQKPTDLEEFINELSKQFPDVSFAKLSRIAVRVAKWAKPTDEEMKELLRTEYEKGRSDAIAEMQKPAWSEEDEKRFKSCLNILQAKGLMGVTDTINSNWLKSIKDRYAWKPSDEQLKAIKWIMDGDNPENWTVTLTNLYNDLKKLSQS